MQLKLLAIYAQQEKRYWTENAKTYLMIPLLQLFDIILKMYNSFHLNKKKHFQSGLQKVGITLWKCGTLIRFDEHNYIQLT